MRECYSRKRRWSQAVSRGRCPVRRTIRSEWRRQPVSAHGQKHFHRHGHRHFHRHGHGPLDRHGHRHFHRHGQRPLHRQGQRHFHSHGQKHFHSHGQRHLHRHGRRHFDRHGRRHFDRHGQKHFHSHGRRRFHGHGHRLCPEHSPGPPSDDGRPRGGRSNPGNRRSQTAEFRGWNAELRTAEERGRAEAMKILRHFRGV